MTPTLHIKLLGTFELVYGDRPLHGALTLRQQSLLAYLVLRCTTPQHRQQLAFLFWPDSTEAQARTNLRRELHHLRQLLPDAATFLCLDGKMIQWRTDAPYMLDVAAFENIVNTAVHAEAKIKDGMLRKQLEHAVALYRGELLPGCYDDWIIAERERLCQKHVKVLDQLVVLLEGLRDYKAAIRFAERLLRHDMLHESTYHRLMRLHALNNDRARALRVYQTCADVLQNELGVEPSSATRNAYEHLLHADASVPMTQRLVSAATPLCGRKDEWQRIRHGWKIATDGRQAHALIVTGEAGIGKTRLAEELLQWASQQGIAVARTRSYAAEGRLAYAPVIEWLRSDALRARVAQLDDIWLTELARLLPEILASHPALPQPQQLTENWQRQRLFEALARAVLAEGQPLMLLLDDMQWCDQDTLEWLHYLLRFDPTAPLLVVGTVRAEEVGADHRLQALLGALRSTEQITEITLGPLSSDETAVLAAHVVDDTITPAIAERVYRETEGNPLFIVEMMRAGMACALTHTEEHDLHEVHHAQLPLKVQTVLAARLAQLSPPAQELACLAATIGRAFTLDVLAATVEYGESVLIKVLDELCERQIVREHGNGAYDFSHDKIREVAYFEMSTARQRLYHRRVAHALETVFVDDLDPVAGQVAAHYEQAGLVTRAILFYQQAATVAQRIYANEEAIGFLQRGLALLETLPAGTERDEQELALQMALGVSMTALKGYGASDAEVALNRAQALCQCLDRLPTPPVLRALAIAFVSRGKIREAHELGEQLLEIACSTNDPMVFVEAQYVLGVTSFWFGQFSAAREHLEQAVQNYDRQQHRTHVATYGQDPCVVCLSRLALTLWYLGYPDQALQHGKQALAQAQELGHPLSWAYALNYVAWISQKCGDEATMLRQVEAVHRLTTQYQLGFWPAITLVLQGWMRVMHGDVAVGLVQMRRGIVAHRASKHRLHLPYMLALLAEAYGLAGDVRRGLMTVSRAMLLVERTEEGFYKAELQRIKGELLLIRDEDAEAAHCFRQALALAHQQGAKSLELRAATSLSRLLQQQNRLAEAHEVLAEVYAWFTEGFDTPDLQEARSLLEAVARVP